MTRSNEFERYFDKPLQLLQACPRDFVMWRRGKSCGDGLTGYCSWRRLGLGGKLRTESLCAGGLPPQLTGYLVMRTER